MTTKNKGGRPALPDAEKAKVRSMRLTDARWDKLKRPNPAISGGASVRLTDGLDGTVNYWLCCGSRSYPHGAESCLEARLGHQERVRFGTAKEHSEWQLDLSSNP